MELDAIRLELAEHYPQWRDEIGVLELRESGDAAPMDNDGRTIFYNARAMRFFTPEHQLFFLINYI